MRMRECVGVFMCVCACVRACVLACACCVCVGVRVNCAHVSEVGHALSSTYGLKFVPAGMTLES